MGNDDPSAKIEFHSNGFSIDTITKSGMEAGRVMTSISDSSGNLLFYTNGIWINNAQHQVMQNGDSLNPGQIANDFRIGGYPSSSSMIILPNPVQTNLYYLFHHSITYASDIAGFGEHLYYTLIDMNANNGLGSVIQKNQILLSDSLCKGQVHAVKHANGRDWWLIYSKAQSNGYYTLLVSDSITLAHEQYIGIPQLSGGAEWTGQCVFSPQGDRYVRYDYLNDLDIFDFDRCSGLLSNPIHIPIQDDSNNNRAPGGTAISPSGQYLYLSSWKKLYQFDLSATNIASTMDTIATVDTSYYYLFPANKAHFCYSQLAPDNKIYIVAPNTSSIHIIDDPDRGGTACNVQQNIIDIGYVNGFFTPNHPHYRTPPLAGSPCDTLVMSTAPRVATTSYDITLFPNPTSDLLHLQAKQPIQQLLVYDALGRVILQQDHLQQQELDLDTHTLAVGTYFISIWVEGQLIRESFQIMR